MKNIITIRMLSIIALSILFVPTLADIDPELAPSAVDYLTEEDFLRETSNVKIMDNSGRLTTDSVEALKGIEYNLQASSTDVQTRGLFHNGISYILVSNPNDVPKMVVVNPQISDWSMQSVQVKYGNLEVKKIWNLLQISVPAFQSGLIIVCSSDLENEHSARFNDPRNTLASQEKTSIGSNYPGETQASEEIHSDGYSYPVEPLAREEKASAWYDYPDETLASEEMHSNGYDYLGETLTGEERTSTGYSDPRNTLVSEEESSTGYNYPWKTLARKEIHPNGYTYPMETLIGEEKTSTRYDYPAETLAREVVPSTKYNYQEERYRTLWETSIVKVDAYGQLTIDGLSGVDYDIQSSNSDVLTRGLLYNGIAYILVANPYDMPKKVIVNPQKSNWYIQNVQVKYGTLTLSKVGNLLYITVPGSQSALIIIAPQKKRYSFTTGPKPAYSSSAGPKSAYSFRAGPKPPYSFCAGPKPSYSFRIGY